MPRCPVCFVPMTRIEEDGVRAHTCPSCFGHWIPGVALQRRLRTDVERARAGSAASSAGPLTPPPSPDAPADNPEPSLADLAEVVTEADSEKPLRCAECEKFMTKERYQQMIPVTVDRCRHCDRIWLDTGEYNLIRRLYVELSLSTDPQIVHLREKVAMVTTEWDSRKTLSQSVAQETGALNPGGVAGLTNLTLNALFEILK